MIARNVTFRTRLLTVAALLSMAPLASPAALAQEAITLESIGAVRMAQPDEARRIVTEQQGTRAQLQDQAGSQGAAKLSALDR